MVARNWAEIDAGQAATWIEALPDTRTKDTALSAFIGGLSDTDPATAVQWVQQISEPKLREQALAQTMRNWVQADPASARAWMDQAGFSDDMKQRALNPKKR